MINIEQIAKKLEEDSKKRNEPILIRMYVSPHSNSFSTLYVEALSQYLERNQIKEPYGDKDTSAVFMLPSWEAGIDFKHLAKQIIASLRK